MKELLGRKLFAVAIVVLIFLGAILASDPRFISHSALSRNPLLAAFLYGPTVIFAVVAVAGWWNGRLWPAAAFAIGLMGTGLFHQYVAGEAYGNPGYMAPTGHIAAPIVSITAYLVSFLGGWAIVAAMNKLSPMISKDQQEQNR